MMIGSNEIRRRSSFIAMTRLIDLTTKTSSKSSSVSVSVSSPSSSFFTDASEKLATVLKNNAEIKKNDAFLIAPERGTVMGFQDFRDRAYSFASAVKDLGYLKTNEKELLSIRLGDSEELLIALVGLMLAKVDMKSAKTIEDFKNIERSRGSLVHSTFAKEAGEIIGKHEPIAVGPAGISEKVIHWEVLIHAYDLSDDGDANSDNNNKSEREEANFYFNSDKADSSEKLFKFGEEAAKAMELGRKDTVMIGVPMLHAMGFGFGALSAIIGGSKILIPGTADGRSDIENRAENAKNALKSSFGSDNSKISAMISDMHIVKALRAESSNAELLKGVRTGLVKVGGGADIGTYAPIDLLGVVPLISVGTMK